MYHYSCTDGNAQGDIFHSFPGAGGSFGEFLHSSAYEPLFDDGTAPIFHGSARSSPTSAPVNYFPTMFNQDDTSQPEWQGYNNSVPTLPPAYHQHYTSYGYQGMGSSHSATMLYEAGLAPQGYGSSLVPSQSGGPSSPSSNLSRSYPSSPQSVNSYSSSPHSPISVGPPSPNVSAHGEYPYGNPFPAAHAPPHILPAPQTVVPRVRIPQGLEVGHNNPRIEFRVNGVLGIRVQDAIRQFVNIDNGENKVLARNGDRSIRITIRWPGTSTSVGAYVVVKDNIHGEYLPITRKQFAQRASETVSRLLARIEKAFPTTYPYRLGTGGITISDLWLEFVVNASPNMWLVELTMKPQ